MNTTITDPAMIKFMDDMAKQRAAYVAKPRNNHGGQLWEDCPTCGAQPVHGNCGHCADHCECHSAPIATNETYGGDA